MTDQIHFSPEELLLSDDHAEPLVVKGMRCHGGFDSDGVYVSPRMRFRGPAIEAWEQKRATESATDPLRAPIETWPAHFPSVEQSTFLISSGVAEPTITELTRIGTVEGFGAMMRYLPLPDFSAVFDDISGTATEHISKGLFEAHSRDEAGWEDEAGHDRMWYAARDIAFGNPPTEDQTALMLGRMGIMPSSGRPNFEQILADLEGSRQLPGDIPFTLEMMLMRMISLLFIEISAFHVFRWAESVLADPGLASGGFIAGDGEAVRLVSHIRQDEAPHVGYLITSLSEMRDREWKGATGATYPGNEMIALIWDRMLAESRETRRGLFLRNAVHEVEIAVGARPDCDDLLEQFWSLGTVHPIGGGAFVEELPDGSEVHIPAA